MSLRSFRSCLVLFFLLNSACSMNARGSIQGGGDTMSREEILDANRGTLYEVVELLRPHWLRMRSDQSVNRPGGIVVYMDDVRFGDLDSLRNMLAREIFEIRRYSATAASQRWGPGHSDGVLEVRTRAR